MKNFRFTNGSLYKFNRTTNAYIHVYASPLATNLRTAVRAYRKMVEL